VAPIRAALSGPPGAPVVVLLHGFLGSSADWDATVRLLAPRLRTLAVDLPGHGETAEPGEDDVWSMEGCAAAVAGLLDSHGVARAAVAGYSLGGRVALHLAVRHPERVSRLVLLSASPGLADEAALAARREEDERRAARLEREGLEAFLADWYRQPLFAGLPGRPRFPDLLARRRRNDPLLLARSLRRMGLGAQRPLHGELGRLRMPLLILAGERDPKFVAIAGETAAACPGAEVRVLPGCSHALVEEAPEAVARELLRFLGTQGGAPQEAAAPLP
jgi:2-succinyl-6-hydroxy-2,4-cyclohexadiene-1-carboxylate synthase